MSLSDSCFDFLDRLEKDGEMTEKNVRAFLRDINHYSREPWEPNARNRALKYAALAFLEDVKDTTNEYQSLNISLSREWLRALAELVIEMVRKEPLFWTAYFRRANH
jgi:hypothetical protein